ncbi:hypothetical protein C7B65_15290 [Phormidesmis priestleyi ULC007]|uniref:Uncharacterized protein n=1 Tax=Phormidesmis priestleyi ULC007 TaxID=1920490 RepID=A0A2T1DDB1_9CYAN|nr:hypothetical protein [Phormidesmis priestleyi]PSB18456.1 hypothetical protein C7B65_15290 [Phormidesmis priestleyi ULC007]PZO48817.1 MAG: hypothetical protein DCF14_15900 [Phormidesmis priestleyi]
MWRVIVYCSADSWRIHATAFKAIAAKYQTKPLSSKKMKDDERRIMEFQVEDVNDAESFQDECMTIEGFTAQFESL